MVELGPQLSVAILSLSSSMMSTFQIASGKVIEVFTVALTDIS